MSVFCNGISSAEQFIIPGLPWPLGSLVLAVVGPGEGVAVKGEPTLWIFLRLKLEMC